MLKQGRICTNEYSIIPVRFTVEDRTAFLAFLRETGEKSGVTIVCLNLDMIAGYKHVETTLIHALRSWKEGRKIARSLEMEILLYAAGTRQTGQIGPLGPIEGKNSCFICILPPSECAIKTLLTRVEEVKDEDWNNINEEKKSKLSQFFGITPEELDVTGEEKLSDLISERSALLTINH